MPAIRPEWRGLSSEEMKRRFLQQDVQIWYPFAGTPVPIYGGCVQVRGQFDASHYKEVWAKVYRAGAAVETPGAAPPPGAVQCRVDSLTVFYHESIPGAVAGSDNKIAAWARHPDTGEWSGAAEELFNGAPQTTYLVNAKRCLYFAFAPDEYEGPASSQPAPERGPLFRPVEVPVPAGAVSVHVVAQGTWNHYSKLNEGSDANGRTNAEGKKQLEQPEYRDPKYGAFFPTENELPLDEARLDRLVGAFVIAGSNVLTEVGLGTDVTVNPIPANAVKLLLAHHDGREWSNNVGDLTVTVTFLDANGAPLP